MTRLVRLIRGPLLGLALCQGACQGELKLDAGSGGGRDLSVADLSASSGPDLSPAGLSFADINADLDKPIYGCTGAAPVCHGGTNPSGKIKLQAGGTMAALQANYAEVLTRVNVATPEASLMLTKPLDKSGVDHMGGKVFPAAADTTYQRWLKWIQLGAKFEFVPLGAGAPVDMAQGGG